MLSDLRGAELGDGPVQRDGARDARGVLAAPGGGRARRDGAGRRGAARVPEGDGGALRSRVDPLRTAGEWRGRGGEKGRGAGEGGGGEELLGYLRATVGLCAPESILCVQQASGGEGEGRREGERGREGEGRSCSGT